MPLIHEEILAYQGFYRCRSRCRIRVYEHRGGLVVVASELDGELAHLGANEGTSITNVAEHLATLWRQRECRPFTWVEHYPARGCTRQRRGQTVWQFGETFDRVSFTWSNAYQRYEHPQWTHLCRADVEALIGEAWPEPPALAEERFERG